MKVFHMVSASAALQTISEILLQSLRFCAFDLICSKSSLVFKLRISKSLFIDLDLVMSLFNAVTMLSFPYFALIFFTQYFFIIPYLTRNKAILVHFHTTHFFLCFFFKTIILMIKCLFVCLSKVSIPPDILVPLL